VKYPAINGINKLKMFDQVRSTFNIEVLINLQEVSYDRSPTLISMALILLLNLQYSGKNRKNLKLVNTLGV
jgi:hypothetical protein